MRRTGGILLATLALGACKGDLQSGSGTDSDTSDSTTGTSASTSDSGTDVTSDGTGTTSATVTTSATTTDSAGSTGPGDLCGNGNVDPGEECDDGNELDADDCEADCTLPACENGIYDPGELCWPTGVEIVGSGTPPELVVAQLDGNTRHDLAFLDDGALHVFLGRADDTFQSKTPLALGTPAPNGALAFADLNDQGQRDVVVTDPDNDKIYLANGLGDGSFGDATLETTTVDLQGSLTDFGIGEFILANFDASDDYPEMFFYFGDDSWGIPPGPMYAMCPLCEWFAWSAPGATISFPTRPFLGDFDGDGTPDHGNYIASPAIFAQLATGDGAGNFTYLRGEATPGNIYPARLAVGDLNGDGADDAVGMYDSRLWVLPGVPEGMAEPVIFEAVVSYNMTDVALQDVDEDGDVDAVACAADGGFLVIKNDGGGTFSEDLMSGPTCDRIVVADFNGDAHVDLGVRLVAGGVEAWHFKP